MARKKQTICSKVGCGNLTLRGESYCEQHIEEARDKRAEYMKRYDKRRGNASNRGYDSRWNKRRAIFLRKNPLCVRCLVKGRVESATVVDHIVPHKGNKDLFWDESNWQSLCKACHDSKTAREDGGFGNKIKG